MAVIRGVAGSMSEVISFRLDNTNPREAQALGVLNTCTDKGFSIRFILTTALIELEHINPELEMNMDNRELGLVLDQINQLLEIVKANPIAVQSTNMEQPILRESFLASIKQGVRPGIKLG